MLFKDRLYELRLQANLTQQALADKAGMSMLTYRNYEQGTRLPGLPAFMKLIKALSVPCEEFAACEDVTNSVSETPGRPRGRPPKAVAPAAPPEPAKAKTTKAVPKRKKKGE